METNNSVEVPRSLLAQIYFFEELSRRCYSLAADILSYADEVACDDLVSSLRSFARSCEDYEEVVLKRNGFYVSDLPF